MQLILSDMHRNSGGTSMPELNTMIEVSDLRKSYQKKGVLDGVSFRAPRGMTWALLGANGAGKTTTVRILATQIKPDSGTVKIAGYDAVQESEKIHEIISLTGQFSAVDEALTGRENLITMGELRQVANPRKSAERLLEIFELSGAADQVVSTYSGGMKRKLDIAMSLMGDPQILFLDEPTTGLDPRSRLAMWDIIRELNRTGVTVFLTTQYLEEAEQLADRIAILDRGRIIAEGTPDELKAYLPQGAVRFEFEDAKELERAEGVLAKYKFKFSSVPEERGLTVFTDGRADSLAEIFHLIYESRLNIREFSQITPDLEDVFFAVTGADSREKGRK